MNLVCALFETHDAADRAVDQLVERGFDEGVVSIEVHSDHVAHEDLDPHATQTTRRTIGGAVAAGAAGAAIGGLLLGATGLIGLGPLAAALAGSGVGALYGGIAGALTGQDAEKPEFAELVAEVDRGKSLVTVSLERAGLTDRIVEALRMAGSHRVVVT
jgi:uncharacterized membrane protein